MARTHAPRIKLHEVRLYERPVRLRLPFRYGVVTMREASQAFVRANIEIDGGARAWGWAAELLAPKWFDKRPDYTDEQTVTQLRLALGLAREAYLSSGANTAFGLHADNYRALVSLGRVGDINALTTAFGPALIDRAILDALGRHLGLGAAALVRANVAGFDPAALAPDLEGFDAARFLASRPAPATIAARHCIGLLDPLTAADHPPEARAGDGLPETLEEVVPHYGNRFFKVKLSGDAAADVERVVTVARVIESAPRPDPMDYRVTLDGNEIFTGNEHLDTLWNGLAARPELAHFLSRVRYFEQPFERGATFERDVSGLAMPAPLLIDESDDGPGAFPRAAERGYRGVSSKSCKGLYKSFVNRARCEHWNARSGDRYFMSGEDLTCQAGVSVQQDLALAAMLGLDNVERNGHHFAYGLAAAPKREQRAFLAALPDLYVEHRGVPCLAFDDGSVAVASLLAAPGFASGAEPHWRSMAKMAVPGG